MNRLREFHHSASFDDRFKPIVFVGLLSPSGLQVEFINPIFEFSKGMNDLHLDEAEYALLIAINIFSAGQVS